VRACCGVRPEVWRSGDAESGNAAARKRRRARRRSDADRWAICSFQIAQHSFACPPLRNDGVRGASPRARTEVGLALAF
jgi:hypothetical protein